MSTNDYRKTLEDLRNLTLLLCQDPEGERFDPDRVDEALNDAALDFAMETEAIKDELNIQVKEDVYIYDVKDLIDADGTLREYGYPIRLGYFGKTQPAFVPVNLFEIDMLGYDTKVWYRNILSPSRIAIIPPTSDGAALVATDPYEDNIQLLYAGLPTYMTVDGDYPDAKIFAIFHQALPHGAAARLLDEGDQEDVVEAAKQEVIFGVWIGRAKREMARGLTDYRGMRPI